MFSTTPSRRMFVFCAIWAARTATCCAALLRRGHDDGLRAGRSWPSEIATSPVPGGMSTTSVSSSPQCTSVRNCSSARCSMGPAPHDRRVVVEEEADRHDLQVAAHRRDDHLVDDDRPLGDAEHRRDRKAVDVGIEHARPLAQLGERGSQVRGERRLADTALPAHDGDDPRGRVHGDAGRALGDAPTELGR